MHVKEIETVDIQKIKSELKNLDCSAQFCFQGIYKDQDPKELVSHDENFNYIWNPKYNGKITPNNCIHPLFNLPYINNIIKQLNLGYTKLMVLKSRRCYAYHTDKSPRIHIPVVTNKDNFFIVEDEIYRLPADGTVYKVDTTKLHCFVNASKETRLHIVGIQR